jgi:AAA domain/Bifunctional DNA primase/polymerase, N-terminal
MLDVALAYHRQGVQVIRVHPKVKRPVETGWDVPRLQDEATVRELFTGYEGNVGILCDNVFAFDLDLKPEEGKDGFAAFANWKILHGIESLPRTFTESTPSGGQHLVYRAPPGFKVRHTIGWQHSVIGKGLDLIGHQTGGKCGQIVVAPSVLVGTVDPVRGGKQVSGPYTVVDDAPIADWPEELLHLLPQQGNTAERGPASKTSWTAVDAGDRTYLARVAFQRDEFAKAPLYLRSQEDHGLQGRTRYKAMFQRLGPGLLLDETVTGENFLEVYNPRLPDGPERWTTPEDMDSLLECIRYANRLSLVKGARPNETWKMEGPWQDLGLPHTPEGTEVAEPAAEPAQAADPNALGITWGQWDAPIVPPVYLLEGLIPEEKVTVFFAEGGSLKTWAALALGISVATGRPWLGAHQVKKGRTLILDFEDGRFEYQRRKRILTRDDDPLPDLGYAYSGIDLTKPASWHSLATLGLKLLIVDALNSAMPSDADENSTEFAAAVKLAGKFTTATGCNVVLIHHANKQGGMRGTSAIRDAADVVFKFESVSETDDVKRMRMVCDKPGPQKKPAPVNVELSDEGLRTFVDEAHAVGRNSEKDDDLSAAILLKLANGPIATRDLVARAIGVRRDKANPWLDALVTKQRVVCIKGIGYQLDSPESRRDRVLAQLEASDAWTSKAKLAKAAYVDVRDVEKLIRDNVICNRVSHDDVHGFMVVSRPAP